MEDLDAGRGALMPVAKVQAPDGRVIDVEHPEGATPDQIIAFAKRQAAPRQMVGETPIAKPGEAVQQMPGPLASMGQRARERAGDIASTVATTMLPGGRGIRPLAMRLLGAEGGQQIGDAAVGNKSTPGYGFASQLMGEGVAKAVAPLVSGIPYRQWAKTVATTLGDRLKDAVPAWAHLPSTEKGLYEMVHGTGQRVLSAAYDKALQAVKGAIPAGRPLMMTAEDAAALGLRGTTAPPNAWAAYQAKRAGQPLPQGMVQVDLREAVDALPGARKGDLGLYRRTLRGVDRELEHVQGGLGADFMAERAAYRTGAGFMDFAERGKFLHGERFDPAKAQAALDPQGKKTLLSRGLDDVRSTIRGPEADPIQVTKRPWWANRLEGAAAGEGLSYLLGVPRGVGGIVGGAAGGMLPTQTYRNVPMTPAMEWASRLTRPALAEGVREAGRELDVPKAWP